MHNVIYAAYIAFGLLGFSIFLRLALDVIWGRKARFQATIWFVLLTVLVYSFVEQGMRGTLAHRAVERSELADDPPDTVRIAGVWPADQPQFFTAIRRAVDEVNAAGGVPVLSAARELKHVKIELAEFPESESAGPRYAEIAQDSSILAVVGHRFIDDAIPASVSYNEGGLLYLVPTITSAVMTKHNFNTVIQMLPNDSKVVSVMAGFLASRKYKRVAILAARTDDSQVINEYFMRAMEVLQRSGEKASLPQVTYFRSYSIKQQRLEELVASLLAHRPDAVVVLDAEYSAISVIRQIRDRDKDLPIVGMPQLETSFFLKELGDMTHNVFVPSLLPRQNMDDPAFDPTGHLVDEQVFESVKLLALAWKRARTVNPIAVAGVLRAYPDWPGRYGTYDFRADGSMVGRDVQMKSANAGLFLPIEPSAEPKGN